MSELAISLIVLACVFGSALLGIYLRSVLPEHHLGADAKDVVKLATGLVATMSALVLGLVVASAKNSFDATDAAVKNSAATILALDRLLARYGPETREIRDLLRAGATYRVNSIWPEEADSSSRPASLDDPEMTRALEDLEDRISRLAPRDHAQRSLQSRALAITDEMFKSRWLLLAGSGPSVPVAFLVALVFWLTVIFGAFGLMAPRNATVIAILLVSALSVAISIFLVLEMEHPFDGYIKVSSAPMRFMLSHLGQ